MIDSHNDNNLNSNNPDNREQEPYVPCDTFEAFEDYKSSPGEETEDQILEMFNENLTRKKQLIDYLELQEDKNVWLINQIRKFK